MCTKYKIKAIQIKNSKLKSKNNDYKKLILNKSQIIQLIKDVLNNSYS